MGYTLKLDIYYFSLKKITKVVTRAVKGGGRTGCQTENIYVLLMDDIKQSKKEIIK